MKSVLAPIFVIIFLLAGCAGSPQSERAPDLSGNWKFQVQAGGNVVHGAMSLTAQGQGYVGTLTTDQGNNVLPVRSLTLDDSAIDMLVESPNGNVTFKGTLGPDGRTFQGMVTYHNGQTFPMSGSKS